jgi:hypothetical protein
MIPTLTQIEPSRRLGAMPPIDVADADIAILFRLFAREAASSPLYASLCPLLADNAAAVSLYDGVRATQRRPNLLFAAMHASVLRDPTHEFARWFATVGGTESPSSPALAAALDRFLHDRNDELQTLVAAGATQTNEIGRSALLRAALALVHTDTRQPLGLVDIGTSGGLNLRLDAYRITYRTADAAVDVGPSTSSVHIVSDASRSLEPIPVDAINETVIGSRRGSDLNPLDHTDETQSRWLRALIWPDEHERFDRLTDALALAPTLPVDIVTGDAVELVGDQLLSVPTGQYPVLITTWVLTYLPEDRRRAFLGELQTVGAQRDFSWVCIEHPRYCAGLLWPDDVLAAWTTPGGRHVLGAQVGGNPVVVHRFADGTQSARWVATVHPHGRWINWHPGGRDRPTGPVASEP